MKVIIFLAVFILVSGCLMTHQLTPHSPKYYVIKFDAILFGKGRPISGKVIGISKNSVEIELPSGQKGIVKLAIDSLIFFVEGTRYTLFGGLYTNNPISRELQKHYMYRDIGRIQRKSFLASKKVRRKVSEYLSGLKADEDERRIALYKKYGKFKEALKKADELEYKQQKVIEYYRQKNYEENQKINEYIKRREESKEKLRESQNDD